jgi:hypothetical protein
VATQYSLQFMRTGTVTGLGDAGICRLAFSSTGGSPVSPRASLASAMLTVCRHFRLLPWMLKSRWFAVFSHDAEQPYEDCEYAFCCQD